MKNYSNIVLSVLLGITLLNSGCDYYRFYINENTADPTIPSSKPFPSQCKFYIARFYAPVIAKSPWLLNILLHQEYPEYFQKSPQSIPLNLYIKPGDNSTFVLFHIFSTWGTSFSVGVIPMCIILDGCKIEIEMFWNWNWPHIIKENRSMYLKGCGWENLASLGAIFIPDGDGADFCSKISMESPSEVQTYGISKKMMRHIVSLVSQLDPEKVRRYYYILNENIKKNKK